MYDAQHEVHLPKVHVTGTSGFLLLHVMQQQQQPRFEPKSHSVVQAGDQALLVTLLVTFLVTVPELSACTILWH